MAVIIVSDKLLVELQKCLKICFFLKDNDLLDFVLQAPGMGCPSTFGPWAASWLNC